MRERAGISMGYARVFAPDSRLGKHRDPTTRLESFTPVHTSRDARTWFHPGTSLSGHRRETSMIRSTTAEWGWPAKLLHWLRAALIPVFFLPRSGVTPLAR